MVAGAGLRAPEPTCSTSAMSRSKEARNAAQCSRSAPCRSASPQRAQRRPQAPSQTASFHASRPWMAGGSSTGRELAISRCDAQSSVWRAIHSHAGSSTIARSPASSTRPPRESSTSRRTSP
jgi:hypothetical protein